MDPTQEFVDRWLDRAISEFDTNPLCSQLIRRLAQDSPEAFGQSALERLGVPEQSAALHLLTGLILRDSAVFEFLSRPGNGAYEQSRCLFGRLISIEPLFDVKLARQLPDRTGSNHQTALTGLRGARALELLDEFSRGCRLIPILAHLADSADPHLRVKAILFVGRRVQSAEWAEKQLAQRDPSVRAIVIESIWGVDTAAARTLLRRCKADQSDKVAGNSLLGLHLLGEPGIVEEVRNMAVAGSEQARATAAWVMGEMGDPGFIRQLTFLARDENQRVRGMALNALARLRCEEPSSASGKEREIAEPAPERLEEIADDRAGLAEEEPMFDLRLDGSSFATVRGRFWRSGPVETKTPD